MTDDLLHVHIAQLPVALWQRAQEHTDELLREFMLIAAESPRDREEHDIPQRLVALVDELTQQYSGFSADNEMRLAQAAAQGETELDLDYDLPRAAVPGAQHLATLLDEADEYCRRGEHLLTLATPPDQVAFRRWFLDEFVRQEAGEPPLPWPEHLRRSA